MKQLDKKFEKNLKKRPKTLKIEQKSNQEVINSYTTQTIDLKYKSGLDCNVLKPSSWIFKFKKFQKFKKMAKKPPEIWAKIKLRGQLLTNNSYNWSQVQNGTWPQIFLVACMRLYKSLCLSVGRLVGWSVTHLLFCVFEHF